ncbi:MAG: DUF533 domain-containing protein [Rubripirellula sp.]
MKTPLLKGTLMDPMDVLGSLLGRKSSSGSSGSSGGNILKDILGRRSAPKPSQPRVHPQARQPRTIDQAANDLEDLLNVGGSVSSSGRSERASIPQQRSEPSRTPSRTPQRPTQSSRLPESKPLDDNAKILIRAMISAAKSDGQVTKDEQEKMLARIESNEEAEFLRSEFNRPADVRGLCWDVPRGMEEGVYTMSLLTIDLDEQKEANYLADLAQGLRMDPTQCNAIHAKYGAPEIFKS